MTIQKLPGSAITPGTITVTQLESSVATTVQTGGGPKLTNIQVTDNTYTVLDDTAVDVTGGYIKITGTGFVTGCSVIVGQLPAASVTFISSTEVRAQLSAQSAGTYIVYLVNPDGGVGIRVNGVTHSASPAWQTASGLPDQYDGVAINLSLVATDATSYTITSGSLPPGLSLNSNTGVISGTVSGVANDTLYTFTVRATDAQLQDSPRTFTVTITVSDPYFKLTTLLLSGSAISANTVIRDSSTNNFNLTVSGDARASNFTPYGTGWSVQFDGSDSLYGTTAVIPATSAFTLEMWLYIATTANDIQFFAQYSAGTAGRFIVDYNNTGYAGATDKFTFSVGGLGAILQASSTSTRFAWHHLVISRDGSNNFAMWVDGTRLATATNSVSLEQRLPVIGNYSSGSSFGLNGYISNLRVITSDYYGVGNATITVPTSLLTAVSGTVLLTCQSNRFVDNKATSPQTLTTNGDTRVVSFNPFNITNTGVNGSAYFDGTGDYLSTSANTAFAMGTGDFTVEFWYYPVTYGSSQNIISHQYTTGFAIGTQTSGTEFYIAGSFISTATRPTLGMWNHVVCQRASGTASIYFNGTRVQTGSLTGSATSTTALVIGAAVHNLPNEASNGYLSDIRIVKGSAVYSGVTITPPAAPLSAIANTSLLTCQYDQPHNNHTFLDSSSNQFLITRSGNASQGTFSPFSQAGWSMFVGGAGYQRWDTNTNYSGTDLTIECWAYAIATTSTFTSLVSSNLGAGNYYQYFNLAIDGSNRLICDFYGTGNVTCNNAASFPLNTWVHCAVVLTNAGAVSLYQDGVRVATTTAASIASIATGIQIGGIVQTSGGAYTAYFNGYISNARIVKSAVYSGTTITVPIAPLSVIANTNLLVCGENRAVDKANGYALGVNTVSRTAVAFSPFAATAVYNPVSHGGSGYFDGTGDYLTTQTSSAFSFNADFTIECWVYSSSLSTSSSLYIVNAGGVYLALNLGTTSVDVYLNSSGVSFSSSATIPLNAWNHIAMVRSGSIVTIYVNGNALPTTGSNSATLGSSSSAFSICGLSGNFPGYLSNFRIVKGTAVYTGNFTPPTKLLAASGADSAGSYPSTTNVNTSFASSACSLLLNFTDAAILDSTGRTVLETAADAKTSSVVTKFTGGSMLFDGNGDNLAAPTTPNLNMGTGDWTIECWVYILSRTLNYPLIFGNNNGSYAAGALALTNSNADSASYNDRFFLAAYDVATPTLVASSTNSLNTWYHLALVRNGTNLVMYRDGISVASRTITSSITFDWGKGGVRVGGGNWDAAQSYFNGYIQDLRVTRGYARYTANFTAPTVPARLK